ncbi:MAG: carboxypeptidase-like regulatory domain-containing protein [Bacteroidetes bacterium]|nr:carboxypeptidase-like regulatory domain-containing protein [Bacteroidota bacterium]
MEKTRFLFGFFILWFPALFSQTPTQIIRGRITDAESKISLPGANIVLLNSNPLKGTTSNTSGAFTIENVPVGRHTLKVTYVGYKPAIIPEILVTSGKECIVNVELEDLVVMSEEVEIKATVNKDKPINPMAMVSARSFNVEETRRYAGAIDDPMRMVANFAGVVANAGVNSNQIVIRGNSPKGLLWRIDGVDIPNPNHFAFVGQSGGGFTIISSQVLNNSDFYTAAFPAQFGNALSGVFDMRFRNGNNFRHEYAIQVGLQGLDIAAEGPFSKDKTSSYLFNYRYSILSFLQYIDPWMKNKIPTFQDLSFKLNFPTPRSGTFSLVGIGGISKVTAKPVMDSTQWQTIDDRSESVLNNKMGAIALIHQINLKKATLFRSAISATYNFISNAETLLNSSYEKRPEDSVKHENSRITASVSISHKFDPRYTLRSGIMVNYLYYNLDIKSRNPFTGIFQQINKGKGNSSMVQAFIESRTDITNNFFISAGIYFQYLALNNRYALEPRLAFHWQVSQKHALNLGYGLHSQLEDIGVYLIEIPVNSQTTVQPNRDLNFDRSHHLVLGYDYTIRPDLRLKIETYYQYLYAIPVMSGSYFSMINSTGGYVSDPLVNSGTGRNAGIDITFEKFMTRELYTLLTVSLFDSKYTGGDGIERNTRFNSNYVINLLGGKEWTVKKKNILGFNLKVTFSGGEHYVPIDLQKSIEQHREVLDEANAYVPQLPSFFYVDLTLTYRLNYRKVSGILAIQVKDLLNFQPDIGYLYDDFNHSIEPQKSIGILPLISYKIEF